MTSPVFDVDRAATELEQAHPSDVLNQALDRYSPAITLSFSGAEDVILIDIASRLGQPFRIFTLDTGRLHPETYSFLETVRKHYRVEIETFFPQPEPVQQLVREKGLYSFYDDGHQECCRIRKVEPLRRALADGVQAYVTGQRKDQSPGTRATVPVVQLDPGFSIDPDRPIVKWNPLANWSSAQVWQYILEQRVPYNPLHNSGFKSIGCAPCTRVTNPGEHERAGRWWWEEATKRECGLHMINLDD